MSRGLTTSHECKILWKTIIEIKVSFTEKKVLYFKENVFMHLLFI